MMSGPLTSDFGWRPAGDLSHPWDFDLVLGKGDLDGFGLQIRLRNAMQI